MRRKALTRIGRLVLTPRQGGPFAGMAALLDALVPRPVGDFFYSLTWPWRKHVFGASDTCMAPSRGVKQRVVEGGDVFEPAVVSSTT